MDISNRIDLHKKFLEGDMLEQLPVSFRMGDYFFANKFKATLGLLKPGLKIEPKMLCVDDFLQDYERMYNEVEGTGQSGFWTAEPFVATPWMEAMLGCPVYARERSFVTEPAEDGSAFSYNAANLEDNSWFLKYMEFVKRLVEFSGGRFPIGQPITRGVSDMMGAVLGQEQLVYEMYDCPEEVAKLAEQVTNVFLKVIENQYGAVTDFYGGYSMGFYHVWTPERCIWFQEDFSSLLSPDMYRQFIQGFNAEICRMYSYSAVHLHNSSFHLLEEILSIQDLKAVEVNKDIGGPSISDMMPVFKSIINKDKCLIIWGSLDEKDIEVIKSELPSRRIFLNIVAESGKKAKELLKLL